MTGFWQKAMCLFVALQVGLVGTLGTGLHSLLGCSHGLRLADGTHACLDCVCDRSYHGGDSPFERRREARRNSASEAASNGQLVLTSDPSGSGCSGDCSICDLLEQYHSAAGADSPALVSTGVIGRQPVLIRQVDANVSARLADSRGPPVSLLA
ncbi:MAG: hypothetical protein AAF596_10255 [Planctomycetota bacterium]